MIISSNQISSVVKAYTSQKTAVRASGATPAAPRRGKDDAVELSPQARELARAYQALRDTPEVRQDLVQRLAAQVADGIYHVPAQDIAAKIIARRVADTVE